MAIDQIQIDLSEPVIDTEPIGHGTEFAPTAFRDLGTLDNEPILANIHSLEVAFAPSSRTFLLGTRPPV
jgi:hypothetical protein